MTAKSMTPGRVFTYGLLLVAALFFLAPLYVMLVTSLKDADQIRTGNLLSLPTAPTMEAWGKAGPARIAAWAADAQAAR